MIIAGLIFAYYTSMQDALNHIEIIVPAVQTPANDFYIVETNPKVVGLFETDWTCSVCHLEEAK